MKCHFRLNQHGPWDQAYGPDTWANNEDCVSNQSKCQQKCDGATLVNQKNKEKFAPITDNQSYC